MAGHLPDHRRQSSLLLEDDGPVAPVKVTSFAARRILIKSETAFQTWSVSWATRMWSSSSQTPISIFEA